MCVCVYVYVCMCMCVCVCDVVPWGDDGNNVGDGREPPRERNVQLHKAVATTRQLTAGHAAHHRDIVPTKQLAHDAVHTSASRRQRR